MRFLEMPLMRTIDMLSNYDEIERDNCFTKKIVLSVSTLMKVCA